jgi:cathepsin X
MGCEGGTSILLYEWIMKNGITDETCSSYEARGWTNGLNCTELSTCRNCSPDGTVAKSKCFVPPKYQQWHTTGQTLVNGTTAMINALQNGPITCAIDVQFDDILNFTGGHIIQEHPITDVLSLDHEISVVGYGTDNATDYWLVRNSWGTSWGELGFFRVERNKNYLGIELDCS